MDRLIGVTNPLFTSTSGGVTKARAKTHNTGIDSTRLGVEPQTRLLEAPGCQVTAIAPTLMG